MAAGLRHPLLMLCLSAATGSLASPVAVYQSETNHARYSGVHQAPLRTWLEGLGQSFEVIGDGQAADPAALARYPVVLVSSTYIVPPRCIAGLDAYVRAGGQLLWFDSPALTREPAMRLLLGLGPDMTYTTLADCKLRPVVDGHPLTAGMASLDIPQYVGNCALSAAEGAQVLFEAAGKVETGDERHLPAVVLNRAGKGVAITFNWVAWLSRAQALPDLLSRSLDYLLARHELTGAELVAHCSPPKAAFRQPEQVALTCRLYSRPGSDMTQAALTLQLRDPEGKALGEQTQQVVTPAGADSEMACGTASLELGTDGLPDGLYSVACEATIGPLLATCSAPVRLNGQERARLEEENRRRQALLRPLLVGTLGDYDYEPRTADGRVDLPRLMEQIETAHMNMYDFLIWHAPTDWEDFQRFLPLAEEKGLRVWVTLCPPSEQGGQWPNSEPYRLDFIRWADEIGKLASEHGNLVAMVIDDFWSAANHELYSPEYIAQVVKALRAQCPTVAFLPTIYWETVGDPEWIESYGQYIDGIVFPYAELQTGDELEGQLKACREWLGPDKLILVNVYASGSSGPAEPGPRTEDYMRKTLTISRDLADGIRVYCLPKDKLLEDHRYAVTAELYGKWRSEDAGQ